MKKPHDTAGGRAEILRAATREFAAHGYAGATTAEIARQAGVTQPLVHHHFGSKRGLWSAVLEALFADLDASMRATIASVSSASRRERIALLLRTLVLFGGERPEFSRLIRIESSAGGEPFDELYERWLSKWIAFFQAELDAAIREGVVRAMDTRLGFFAVVGACLEAASMPLVAARAFGIDVNAPEARARNAELVVELILEGMLARPGR